MMSLMVTMPAVPPCSSTTTQIFVQRSCMVSSSFAMGMLSGTAGSSRMFHSESGVSSGMSTRSLVCTNPTRWSFEPLHTG